MPGITELKEVANVLRAADKIEEYQIILKTQQELLEQHEKIVELKQQNRALEERLKKIAKVEFKDNAYWKVDPSDTDSGPFCAKCLDKDGQLVHLQRIGGRHFSCHACKSDVYTHISVPVDAN